MRKGVGHEAFVLCVLNSLEYFRMGNSVTMCTINPERDFKLVVGQRPIDVGAVIPSDKLAARPIAFLAVIGHINND